MGLLSWFKARKAEEIKEEPKTPEKLEETPAPEEPAQADLPLCDLCGEQIHEKPTVWASATMHKKCMRKIRRHPEKYVK